MTTNRPTITITITTDLDLGYPEGTAAQILQAPTGTTVEHRTIAGGRELPWAERFTVNQRCLGHAPEGLADDDLMAWIRSTPAVEVKLSADGRPVGCQEWHQGDAGDPDKWVAYERWTSAGRVGHGFVHPVTRRLVQAG